MNIVLATWCLSQNIGDTITTYLIKKITGISPVFVELKDTRSKILGPGSILNWANENCVVWGAGASTGDAEVNCKKIHLVRGPLSRCLAMNQGCKNEIAIGDPAFLLPDYYCPDIKEEFKFGLIPHYVDQEIVFKLPERDDTLIIDVFDPIEVFIRKILSCRNIISSSLHGLIIAAAYGKESLWVKWSDKIEGDGTKYHDYYASLNVSDAAPIEGSNYIERQHSATKQDTSNISLLNIKQALYNAIDDVGIL